MKLFGMIVVYYEISGYRLDYEVLVPENKNQYIVYLRSGKTDSSLYFSFSYSNRPIFHFLSVAASFFR